MCIFQLFGNYSKLYRAQQDLLVYDKVGPTFKKLGLKHKLWSFSQHLSTLASPVET